MGIVFLTALIVFKVQRPGGKTPAPNLPEAMPADALGAGPDAPVAAVDRMDGA
jgi:hypothetical protein